MRPILLMLFVLIANPAYAEVSIHEIAWMGSLASANHEWIELYNSSHEPIVVDGWTLSDGMNFNITLAGSVAGGSYAVLERTSEASSVASAFLIYTGALVNTGATLTLRDATAGIVDQVAGGVDWKNIGGDNTTKETAQYQNTGWVTDTATPGQPNGGGRVKETLPEESVPVGTTTVSTPGNQGSGSKSRSSKSSDSVRLKNPEVKLTVLPDVQAVAYTHQLIPFNVKTGGVDESLEKLVRYEWNFGDSYIGVGKNPEHSYAFPGTYVVTVRAEYKKNVQVARHELTILPVNFSLTQNSEGDIQLNNDAVYDVDVSGYKVRGSKEVTFPARTIMAARSTVTLLGGRIKESPHELVSLYDPRGELVTTSAPKNIVSDFFQNNVVSKTSISGPTQSATLPPVSLSPTDSGFGFEMTPSAEASEPVTTSSVPKGNDIPTRSPDNRAMYFVFIGVLLLAVVSLLLPKSKSVDQVS